MISVLTFDISKNSSGWAVGTPEIMDGKTHPGWGYFVPDIGDDKEHLTLVRLWKLLTSLHEKYQFTNICWERIFVDTGFRSFKGKAAAHEHDVSKFQFAGTRAQFHIEGVLLLFCGLNGIHASDVAINTWRMRAYGISQAPPDKRINGVTEKGYWKGLAIAWAAKRGYYVERDDEAEALCIMDWLLSMLDDKYERAMDPLFHKNQLDQMFKRGIHSEK